MAGASEGGADQPGSVPVLATTLHPSPYPADPLVRPRLLDLLTTGVQQTPLTLVSAPPGSGKTVLAASWTRAHPLPWPVAWLSVDDTNDQPASFWAYLAAALSSTGVQLPSTAAPPLRAEDTAGFLEALAADLLRCPHPLVCVLDGAEHLQHRALVRGLDTLLRHAGARLRLVLCARGDPRLPLHRYRVAGAMTEVRSATLALDVAEVQALLTAAGAPASREVVQTVVERTQGWAAGVRLAAAALVQDADPLRCLQALEHDDGSISEYLRAEVLEVQPPEVQRALLRSSVSERVWPQLLDLLTEGTDSRRTLAALARANAFVERCPTSTGAYQVHPLFRRCLRHLLEAESASVVPELHRRCAGWFAAARSPVAAAQHAGAAGDWAHVAELLVEGVGAGALLLREDGAAHTLLTALPENTHGDAAAVLRTARTVRARGAVSTADVGRLRALALDPTASSPLATSAAAVHALVTGEAPDDGGDPTAQTLAGWARARAGLGGDRVEAAVDELRAALALSDTDQAERMQRECVGDLALLEALRGQLGSGLRLASTAEDLAERAGLSSTDRAATPALALAWVHAEQHALPAAQHWVRAVQDRLEDSSWLQPLVSATWARVHRLHRRLAEAERALADEQGAAAPGPAWVRERATVELALVQLARRRPHDAVATAATARGSRRAEAVRSRALAEVAARTGTAPPARQLPEDAADLDVQVQGWIDAAAADLSAGATGSAVEYTERALALAEPELARRPFVEAPGALRQVLSTDPRLRVAAGWLHRDGAPNPADPTAQLSPSAVPPGGSCVDALSDRELELLRHLSDLLSTEEIAARMYISVHTVRTHVRSVLRKLAVRRRNEAVRRARELQLI
ncbi:LuxR C-terminal-related transcriptional regulator [Rhodococcus sp. X156]|uniref:helix-turn-helix transcriptional regulator n=1 Tax=Rhodococcus sp. X156 TaxID=2499145 RepID=UPI000FD6E835|nr:LuxR C-terminal-related transcriptional regulator [Rhodococcus sp. X156]